MEKRVFVLSILFCCSFWAMQAQRAQWMPEARWGVMTHYLADWMARTGGFEMNVAKWNEMVNNFDVEGLADQLQKVGAGYYIITIGQNSGYFLAPNPVYDRLTGISPSKCSRRDLVADLSQALRKKGIRLIVYLPSGAPAGDKEAVRALEWTNGPYPNIAFQQKWEEIISCWSSKWGMGAPRFTSEQVVGWSKQVIEAQGAITWDVPVEPNGLIPEVFILQLTGLGKELE